MPNQGRWRPSLHNPELEPVELDERQRTGLVICGASPRLFLSLQSPSLAIRVEEHQRRGPSWKIEVFRGAVRALLGMGYLIGYSELLLPTVVVHIALLLGYVRRFIFRAFEAVGLGDLLDADAPWPENSGHSQLGHHHPNEQQLGRPQFRWLTATLIQEALPVVRYEELAAEVKATTTAGKHVGGSCIVCLNEFEAVEEVRRLSNCRHVFHRGCLDRWLEQEQCTCPLCRAPLLPGDAGIVFNDQIWSGAGVPDSNYDDLFSLPFASTIEPPSPTALLPHQLFSAT